MSPEEWLKQKEQIPKNEMLGAFGAPGTLKLDTEVGIYSEEDIKVRTPTSKTRAEEGKEQSLSPEEWLAQKKTYGVEDIPGKTQPPSQVGRPKEQAGKDYSAWETLVGVGEAGLGTAVGMVGMVGGALAGATAGILTGDLGKKGGAGEGVAKGVMETLSFQPKTPAGQEYTENVGIVIRESGLMGALPGMIPKVGGLGSGSKTFLKEKILPPRETVSKQLEQVPVVEHLDTTTHVTSWKEQLATLPPKEEVPVTLDKVTKEDGTPDVKEDGKPWPARHYKDAEGKTIGITIDPEAVKQSWETSTPEYRPWIKENFPTPEKYQEFILEHELEHARSPQLEGETTITYEKRTSKQALDKLKEREENKKIPSPDKVGDAADFNTKGQQVLKEHGPEIAERWAHDVLAFKRNFDLGIPENKQSVADMFYRFSKNGEADKVDTTTRLVSAETEGVTLDMKIRWREYAEGERTELAPEEMSLFNKYYLPEAGERTALIKSMQEKGWVVPVELAEEIAGSNVARKTVPKQLSMWEKIKKGLVEGHQGGLDLNIEKTPAAAMERNLFAMTFPSGQRIVVQKIGNSLIHWNKGKKSLYMDKITTPVKAGTKFGMGTLKEASVRELEKHTQYKYNKDSQAVLYERVNQLRAFYRSKQMLENLKKSAFFETVAHKITPDTVIPDGFRIPKALDKLPDLAGYAFEKNISYIIEDFAKHWEPTWLTKVSGVLIKNMMLNPIPHMLNEAWHVYNARGLSGWVTPAGIHRFATTAMPAIKEVMTQGPQFRSLLRDGGSLLSADVRNNHIQNMFMEKGTKEFVNSPDGRAMAERWGMKPLELYNALSRKSSTAMWVVRDAMYMQLIKEKMLKGMSQKEAIFETERHLPAYKLPEKVLGSRMVSEVLQNPNVTIFSRYHYGMTKSIYETAADLTGKRGKKNFIEGADTAAAIVVALAILYPLQDMLAQSLTSNPNATTRRAGPYHPAMAIAEIAHGEKDPQAFLASVFTFNPALLYGAQLVANRKLYNGQPVYSPTDDPKLIAKDVWKYTYTQVPQVSTSVRVSDEKKGGGIPQWLAQQVDIKSPTKAEVEAKETVKQKLLTASKNKAKKDKRGY